MLVKLDKLNEEFLKLREKVRDINPKFTVNLTTIPKVAIIFTAPSFYEENDTGVIQTVANELKAVISLIDNFSYNGYKIDIG